MYFQYFERHKLLLGSSLFQPCKKVFNPNSYKISCRTAVSRPLLLKCTKITALVSVFSDSVALESHIKFVTLE